MIFNKSDIFCILLLFYNHKCCPTDQAAFIIGKIIYGPDCFQIVFLFSSAAAKMILNR